MAGFLTQNEISIITGLHYSGFLTFAIDNIIVHLTPKKSFVSTNYDQRVLPGYSAPSIITQTQFIHESGVFPAIVKPNKLQKGNPLTELNTVSMKGQTIIKTTQAGGDYIKNNKIENIEISGRNDVYNVISDEAVENFQGLKFYLFGLEKTS